MKIAIVCDDLIQFGGAEKVVEAVAEVWPKAPIYTSVASSKWQEVLGKRGVKLTTSFMQKVPFAVKLNRYYSPFLLHILAMQNFDFSQFDVVLSLSSRYAHFIITKPSTKHICYMHSPGRMFWEPFDYFEKESFGALAPLRKIGNEFLKPPSLVIRILDYISAQRVDCYLANSKTTSDRVARYYGKHAHVLYPFVDLKEFVGAGSKAKEGGYFLIISRLASWKKIEIAIEACESLGVPLKIAGVGPDLNRLKEYAGKNTEFLGYVDGKKKRNLICGCRALINTQFEDFGIVPLEAMACGKPVIAFAKGGALETLLSEKTGEFFYKQDSPELIRVLGKFDPRKYNPQDCIFRASEFSKEKFQREVEQFVNNVYLKNS